MTATRVTSLPGPGRRRDRHEREAGAGDLVVAGVVAHVARVGEGHGGRLGRVHRAAAADRDDAVGLVIAQRRQRVLDVGERRVGLDVAEDADRRARRFQALDERPGRALLEQEAIGDDERALDADARDVLGEIVGRARRRSAGPGAGAARWCRRPPWRLLSDVIRDPSTLTGAAVACPTMPASEATVNGQYGTAVRRREDPPLIQGTGTYTDDVDAPGALHAHFVRSEVAHGRIVAIDTAAAAAAPGVAGVFTGADLDLGPFPPRADGARRHAAPDAGARRGALPGRGDRGRRGREPRAQAVDAAELVEVDIEPLDVVVDPSEALDDDAPQLFAEKGRTSPSQGGAGRRGRARGRRRRSCAAASSTSAWRPCRWSRRAAVAAPDPETGGVRIWAPLQAPHTAARRLRRRARPGAGRRPRDGAQRRRRLRRAHRAPTPSRPWSPRPRCELGKPVRYVESRWETMIAMQHGRAQVQDVELGARSDGTLVGIKRARDRRLRRLSRPTR